MLAFVNNRTTQRLPRAHQIVAAKLLSTRAAGTCVGHARPPTWSRCGRLKPLYLLFATICAFAAALPLHARTWRDATGRFQVEGDFVSANEELVVVRANDRLLAFELKELSDVDREFVAKRLEEKPDLTLGDAKPESKLNTLDQSALPADNAASPTEPTKIDRLETTATNYSWKLTVPDLSIDGQFFGFSLEPLIISRRGSQMIVGNTPVRELPEFYRATLPLIVGSLEGVELTDLRSLISWFQRAGAGPLEYEVESLVIENDKLGRLTIPLFLLDPTAKARIEQQYERWKLANASTDSLEVKDRYMSLERFLTRAEMAEQVAEKVAVEQVHRQIQLLRLEQLAANTNVTDLWEVVLSPAGYGYPMSVVIPGRNSAEAQQFALMQYPGYRLSGIRKATY